MENFDDGGKLRRWRSHVLGGAKVSFPHECDSHTVTEGVRYTPFRIPHRRGTAVARPTATSASVYEYQCTAVAPLRLPVLPSGYRRGSPYNYQCLRLRLPLLPSTSTSAPQWLSYDYQCLPFLHPTLHGYRSWCFSLRLPLCASIYEY